VVLILVWLPYLRSHCFSIRHESYESSQIPPVDRIGTPGVPEPQVGNHCIWLLAV
jgi:hypothetical protein